MLSQDLLSLQMPLFERMMEMAPPSMHTMIVSGDVLIRTTQPLQAIPEADVVCYGLWLSDEIATGHGVFVADRKAPSTLKCMVQKPSMDRLADLRHGHVRVLHAGHDGGDHFIVEDLQVLQRFFAGAVLEDELEAVVA